MLVYGAGAAWSRLFLPGAGADPIWSEPEAAPGPRTSGAGAAQKVAAPQHCFQVWFSGVCHRKNRSITWTIILIVILLLEVRPCCQTPGMNFDIERYPILYY